jgi:hypothetical protein
MDNIASITCQWIGPEQQGPVFKYTCLCARVLDRAYCEEHLWQVYQKGSNLRKRHKDLRVADNVHTLESLMNEAIAELEDEGVL